MPRRERRQRRCDEWPGRLMGDSVIVYQPRYGVTRRIRTRAAAMDLERAALVSPENLAAFLPLLRDGAD